MREIVQIAAFASMSRHRLALAVEAVKIFMFDSAAVIEVSLPDRLCLIELPHQLHLQASGPSAIP